MALAWSFPVSRYFAHSLAGRPPEDWEPLEVHLQAVADLAGEFADRFGATEWGRVLGLWHDLGKYSAAFQAYLRAANGIDAHLEQQPGRVDHSTAGAKHAVETLKPWGRLLAYAIAGHHAGLSDSAGGTSSLAGRLAKRIEPYDAAPSSILRNVSLPQPTLSIDTKDEARASFQLGLFARMLFSCLVDADFLATESFMNPEQAKQRPTVGVQIDNMAIVLDQHLSRLAAGAPDNEVGRRRQKVLAACRAAANQPPGLFTLTVPTGGGKLLPRLHSRSLIPSATQ